WQCPLPTWGRYNLVRLHPIVAHISAKYSESAWLEHADPGTVAAKRDAPAPAGEIVGRHSVRRVEHVHTGSAIVLDHNGTPPPGRFGPKVEIAQVTPALFTIHFHKLRR